MTRCCRSMKSAAPGPPSMYHYKPCCEFTIQRAACARLVSESSPSGRCAGLTSRCRTDARARRACKSLPVVHRSVKRPAEAPGATAKFRRANDFHPSLTGTEGNAGSGSRKLSGVALGPAAPTFPSDLILLQRARAVPAAAWRGAWSLGGERSAAWLKGCAEAQERGQSGAVAVQQGMPGRNTPGRR
jgi:hypothetical protein